jgi:hypothetical protein
MKATTASRPQTVRINRTLFRQSQKSVLRRAKGRTVVVLTARQPHEEKCVVDKQYFDEILGQVDSLQETLEIMADTKLFNRLLRAQETIDEDLRSGRLHAFEEAFRED